MDGNGTSKETQGQRLARIRKALGITQVELARRMGISQPALSSYERGRLRLNGEIIIRLTRQLGVSSDELLGLKSTTTHKRRRRKLHEGIVSRLERIALLPLSDQKALLRTIDAYLRDPASAP